MILINEATCYLEPASRAAQEMSFVSSALQVCLCRSGWVCVCVRVCVGRQLGPGGLTEPDRLHPSPSSSLKCHHRRGLISLAETLGEAGLPPVPCSSLNEQKIWEKFPAPLNDTILIVA